ncbi:MAG: hypothetical protein H8E86_06330 [Planctomycetes bacterium]|nr:hypothetical protein [Planctomycetota bacterium]
MKTLLLICLFCCCFMLSSCNIAAGVSYIITPDPSQKAIYTLQDVRTVVFVDDRRNTMHPSRLRLVVADRVTTDLLSKKIITTLVSPKDVFRVSATNDRYNEPLPIAALGKSVEADVVIYVELDSFGLTNDGQTANPTASCSLRVISVAESKRLFPTDQASHFVRATLKKVKPHRIASNSEIRKLAEELAQELGDAIAKVFYDHNIGRLGENLNRK